MDETRIEEITTDAALRDAYPVMEQLRPVGVETFLELVEEMQSTGSYRLYGMRDAASGELRALAGPELGTTLYHGKRVWVHDLVVDEPYRGSGYGGRLLDWIETWAEDRDCTRIELASGLWREDAHRFYEANGMEKYCYTFKTDLAREPPY